MDFIDTRRGSIGPEARTRLAEAVRQLQAAQDKRATNLSEAIAHANGADMLAGQAQTLASDRRSGRATVVCVPAGAVAAAAPDMGGVIGGIIIGNILSGALRGGFGGGFGGRLGMGRSTVVRRVIAVVGTRLQRRRWPLLASPPLRVWLPFARADAKLPN